MQSAYGALQQGAQQFGGGQPMQSNPQQQQSALYQQFANQQQQPLQQAGILGAPPPPPPPAPGMAMGGPVGMAPPNPYEQQVGQEDPRMQAMRYMQQMNFGE